MTYRGINFNGYQGTAYGLQFWCNFFPTNWWLADRLLVLVYVPNPSTGTSEKICLSVYNSGLGEAPYNDVLTYELDSNNYCIIDLTEIMRTYPPALHYIYVTYGQGNEPPEDWGMIVGHAAKGLINPAGVIIPKHPLEDNGVIIMPPTMMYRGEVRFEWRANTSGWMVEELYEDMSQDVFLLDENHYVLQDSSNVIQIYVYKGTGASQVGYPIKLRDLDCEKKYAEVEWLSFSGEYRRHVFEVRDAKNETDNTLALMNLSGEFTEIKGRTDTFNLYLDGLNAYDMWYYSDIMQSSKVRVSLDGGRTFRRVSVLTKGIEIPNTNIFTNKLEINVKWQEYDAVIL